ncbi:phytanoyl-CoA dioxygenase family protein [Undibacterium flavidum]|uniref:Phytanoyl-CoA dioxygenase family protein n=1 Tax=Undibacterium flavidum TaxID=2762297 RepID=A0ABR6Y7S9_9BURK|nr:phytanoyl-CoA dioxygenase family protein [Undibacterium flavidum]MBC3872683.1 phytanoyl-CoA dioxygenase family protein [Undibacterium flavidum]
MQDWAILEKLWQRQCDPRHRSSTDDTALWRRQVQLLYANNIAHPVALKFLTEERPTLQAFYDWIERERASYHLLQEQHDTIEPEYRLSPEQVEFWQTNGYLVLPQVIAADACAASCDVIWEYLNASPQDPASWYSTQTAQQGLMLPLYNHPRLNTNRASKRVRAAYEQLYGSRAIYKTIDHLSFNPPETAQFTFRGNDLHWDVSLALPIPERYQGLLYLSDCTASEGAFHCVPGFQHEIANWLSQLKPGDDARRIAPQTLKAQAVPGKAGDFVIWHQALPHCATPNRGKTPRMVQYLTYIPDGDTEHPVWI